MQHSVILRQALLTLHFIGLAFGLGGAAVADFSFFRALKMGDRLTPETVTWMRSFSLIVWAGIGLLGVSGIGLFLMRPSYYLTSPGFLAKMLFVGILIINGLFLNFYTTARLTTFNFSEKYTRHDAAWKARKLSFVFGAISAVSWYATLLIAQFKNIFNLSFQAYVLIYLVTVCFAIIVALIAENKIHAKLPKKPDTIDQLAAAPPTTPAIPRPTPLNPSVQVNNMRPASVPPAPITPAQPTPSYQVRRPVSEPPRPIAQIPSRNIDSYRQPIAPTNGDPSLRS